MLFTKWRFLFNIVSNSRNPSFVKVDLKEGPRQKPRAFCISGATFLKAPSQTPEHLRCLLTFVVTGRAFYTYEKPSTMAGLREVGGKSCCRLKINIKE